MGEQLIGAARVYFDDGGGFLDLGNTPEMTLAKTSSSIKHYENNPLTGKRVQDKSLVIDFDMGLNFKLDEFNNDNMDRLFFGGGVTDALEAGGAVAGEAHTAHLGRILFTTKRDISAVVVTDVGAVTTFVLGTDYEITDPAAGAIKILSTGSITEALALEIDYTNAAGTRKKIQAGKKTEVTGAARLEFKANSGQSFTWMIPSAVLKTDGDTALSSEDWSGMEFTLEVLADLTGSPAAPHGEITVGTV